MKKVLSKDMANKLVELFSPLNERVDNINYGGCGIAAVAIAIRLKELGYKAEIIACTTSRFRQDITELKEMNRVLRQNRLNNTSNVDEFRTHSHYVVKCGRIYIDTETVYIRHRKRLSEVAGFINCVFYPIGKINIADLAYLNGFPYKWNSDFNRADISKVVSYIQDYLCEATLAA